MAFVIILAISYLRLLVAGFPPWLPEFIPRSDYVGFAVDKMALGNELETGFVIPKILVKGMIVN